jgi:Fe-S cluster assembly ATP-binding protein
MSLTVRNLSASINGKKILKNLSFELPKGKLAVLMGPNGSGKSTLSNVLMGNSIYALDEKYSKIILDGKDITIHTTEDRAKSGLFLAFQNPVSITGVNIVSMIRSLQNTQKVKSNLKSYHNPALKTDNIFALLLKNANYLNISKELLKRGLNEDFSGGEKKKLEMLQALLLAKKYAIFDEIDTGLDVDALKLIAKSINKLKSDNIGILLITHYQRILKYVKPDMVLVMIDGKIVQKGSASLVDMIEKNGYSKWIN